LLEDKQAESRQVPAPPRGTRMGAIMPSSETSGQWPSLNRPESEADQEKEPPAGARPASGPPPGWAPNSPPAAPEEEKAAPAASPCDYSAESPVAAWLASEPGPPPQAAYNDPASTLPRHAATNPWQSPFAPQPEAARPAGPAPQTAGPGDWDLDFGPLNTPAPSTTPPAAAPSPSWAPPPGLQPPAPQPGARPTALKLEVTVGQRTSEIVLRDGELLIGRADPARGITPAIDLTADDAVSRRHARVARRGGACFLTDLGSTNGTKLNNRWIEPNRDVPIAPGDRIELGALTTICVLEASTGDA
jgi:hypothetical protein